MYQTKSFFSLTEYEVAQIALELWKAGVTNITKEKISYPECVALVKEAHSIKYDVTTTGPAACMVNVDGVVVADNPHMVDRTIR